MSQVKVMPTNTGLDALERLFRGQDWKGFRRLAESDPLLLLEQTNTRYCVPTSDGAKIATTTWAERLAIHGLLELLDVALRAGAHPDDSKVFVKGPLLCSYGWWSSPERVELALRYGANPDSRFPDGYADYRYVGRTVGQRLVDDVARNSEGLRGTQNEVQSLLLLLKAGAREVCWTRKIGEGARPSTAWILSRATTVWSQPPMEAQVAAAECMGLLKATGDDIDSRYGNRCTTPLVESIRGQSRVMMDALVDCGAILDDAHHSNASEDELNYVGTLEEEAQLAWGEEGPAYVAEARMRRAIAAARPTPAAPVVAPPARRRRAV